MDNKEIYYKVKQLGDFYQPVDFGNGVVIQASSKQGPIPIGSKERGLKKWEQCIEPNLPCSLEDIRVLDVGCSAGLYMILACRAGARAAVGIETSKLYCDQAKFLIEVFSDIDKKHYDISIIEEKMEEVDYNCVDFGIFDVSFCLNALYHVGKAKNIYGNLDDKNIEKMRNTVVTGMYNCSKYMVFQDRLGGSIVEQSLEKNKIPIIKRDIIKNNPYGKVFVCEGRLYR